MKYQQFIKEALKAVDTLPSNTDMYFAYIVAYSNFNMTPAEAIQFSMSI
jgi:hypothetical protein